MQHVQRSCCMESDTQDALSALDELIPATWRQQVIACTRYYCRTQLCIKASTSRMDAKHSKYLVVGIRSEIQASDVDVHDGDDRGKSELGSRKVPTRSLISPSMSLVRH
jgi:hypothetical protein